MVADPSSSSQTVSSKQSDQFQKLVRNLGKDFESLHQTLEEKLAFKQGGGGRPEEDGNTYPKGISLLTLKNETLLDYLHHLVLLSSHRLLGNSLVDAMGSQLVKGLVRLRLVLEKIKPLESRLRYQVDKLLRAADDSDREIRLGRVAVVGDDEDGEEEQEEDGEDVDLLAFRPNVKAFVKDSAGGSNKKYGASRKGRDQVDGDEDQQGDSDEGRSGGGRSGIYRPPKLAPVAYDPDSKSAKRRGGGREDEANAFKGASRNSALLSDLTAGMSSNPYEISSGGVGVGGSINSSSSARAKALKRMQEYEEENFTRLIMSKKDAKRRRRDEEDVALGGSGLSSGRDGKRRIGGGMEEEFGDLLRGSSGFGERGGKSSSSRSKRNEDAYESLRSSKRSRSLARARESGGGTDLSSSASAKRKSKFKQAVKDHQRGR
ncbi:hypothetical protein IE53DRAFT_389183 [Violaceomyces palustris]|uniref:Uncharacterized protein n=1 Tax=Violaceomyces palustris TaxID=1673888 RepID=A0ACD0NS19_9BASI|nr:hypothetical protein IE53DRAFT_389183 [Violaceomyces palustris]